MDTAVTATENVDLIEAVRIFTQFLESQNNVKIKNTKIENNVVKPGENFCSGICRLKFDYEKGGQIINSSILLKIPSLSVNYEEIRKTNIYDNEICVYQKLLPKFYEFWNGERFSPEFYCVTDAKVLVLEDLTVKGYRTGDQRKQLDLEHGQIALNTLARYHAITVKYLQNIHDRGDLLPHSLIEPIKATETDENYSQQQLDHFITINESSLTQSLRNKLESHRNKLKEIHVYRITAENDPISVISHGDFWTKNILFQYEDGDSSKVKAVRMIDWQLSRKTSPIVDIIYLFVTSLQFEVFQAHRDVLLDSYLETFNATLCTLKCGCNYSRSQLDEDMEKYKLLHLNLLISALPLAFLEKDMPFPEAKEQTASEKLKLLISKWLNYLETNNFL